MNKNHYQELSDAAIAEHAALVRANRSRRRLLAHRALARAKYVRELSGSSFGWLRTARERRARKLYALAMRLRGSP